MDKKSIRGIIVYDNSVKCTLSFRPLIKYWKKQAAENKIFEASYNYLRERLKNAPELTELITDHSLIERHRDLVEDLLSISLPPGIQNECYAATLPDRLQSFYETPAFKKLELFDNQLNSICFNENCCITPEGRLVSVYAWLLGYYYKLNVSYEYPLIYSRIDRKNGLEKYYRIRIFSWFCEMTTKTEPTPLTETQKKLIFENLDNPKVLSEIVPPDNFELEGFFIYSATEITDHETLSSLKFDLIGKEPLTSKPKFENLQHKLKVLLKKPELQLGLIAFTSEKKDMNNAIKMGHSIIMDYDFSNKNIVSECKIYQDVIANRELKLIYDLKDYGCSSELETKMLNSGIRNLLIAPLIYKDELIGLLEVASSVPGDLNKINILKLKDVYPLFAVCIESSLDDLTKSIQTVIKEKCTAIHPSVEWRFRDAAFHYINNLRNDVIEDMEEIVFENVYPFYGCSDVKDSSLNRNEAVRSDLLENLNSAKKIIVKASSEVTLPILEELSYRISNQTEILERGLSSSSETELINFIRNEIGSTFEYLKETSPELKKLISGYKERLDPKLGFLFKRRKEFEESIALINETISMELDIQQDKAQKILPHYFEKYKTDGVEYNMYAGSALVADKKFNQMHYKSLRLWQLVTMCIIAKKCIELKQIQNVPLDTTHLIFVQNAPITIKFLYDEKKFDVAGSYDVRHEIIKKRIDKAQIKGRHERLVSPGKIAIIYSQEAEAEEYKQYIEFLKTKKYITSDVEYFEVEDLQSVQGLKALRISVDENFVIEKNQLSKIAMSNET